MRPGRTGADRLVRMIQRAQPQADSGRTRRVATRLRPPSEGVWMFAAALLLRAGYAWLAHGPSAAASSDAASYDTIAWNLARGLGFSLDGAAGPYPTAFVPPLMPWLVSVLYRLAGHDVFAAIQLMCGIGATVPLLLRAVTTALAGESAGRIAGWLAVGHPLLVFFSGHLLTESMFTAMLLLAIHASLEWVRNPQTARAAGAGVLWGLAALTRPVALPLPLLVAAWAWLPLGLALGPAARRRQLLALLAGWAIAVGPWTLRNAAEFGAFIPVTVGGGRSLLDANNPLVWDDPALRGGATSVYHLEPYASALRGRSEPEQDAVSARLATEFAWSRSGDWPRMAAAKLARLWRLTAEAGTTGTWAREGSPLRPLLAAFDPLLIASLVTFPLALAGAAFALAGSRRLYQSLPLLVIAFATLGAVVYWGALRLRAPIEPLVIAYAGLGAAEMLRRWRLGRSGLAVVERPPGPR